MLGLFAYFGDLESAWRASPADLAGADLSLKVIEHVVQALKEELSSILGMHGLKVINCLACGVDAIAHLATLMTGGRTIGVLGHGVDKIYPYGHRDLNEQILDHGVIFSDYAPSTPTDASIFPSHNRIISCLSLLIGVIKAGETIGLLITADFVAEQ